MKRLLDDPALSAHLRDDLLRANEAVHRYDALARLPQLEAALSRVAVPPRQVAGWSARLGAGLKTKLLVVAALGCSALLGALWTHSPAEPRPPLAAAPTRPPPLPALGPTAPPAPIQEPEPEVATPEPRAADPVAPQPSAPRREILELQRMRALLDSDPAGAYRVFRRSERQFPNGVLGEERQALAVVALVRMGERAAAEQSAQRFLERYPRSPLRERVAAALRE